MSECVIWDGKLNGSGYGVAFRDLRRYGTRLAHRRVMIKDCPDCKGTGYRQARSDR